MRSWKLGFAAATGMLISFACGSTERSIGPTDSVGPAGGSSARGDDSAGASGEGTGTLAVPPPVACGIHSCKAIVLGGTAVPPCCVDPAQGICGADVSARVPMLGCQPLTQAGELDPSCPSSSGSASAGLTLPPAPGCCSAATRQCGYWISDLGGLLPFAPGCVDPKVLGAGGASPACGGNDDDTATAGRGSGGAGSGISAAGAAAGAPLVDGPASGGEGSAAEPMP